MPRPPVKATLKVATAFAEGLELGKLKAHEKWDRNLKKSIPLSLREHLGKMIDRLDPLDLAATLALTPIVRLAIKAVKINVASAGELIPQMLWLQFWPLFGFGPREVPTKEQMGLTDSPEEEVIYWVMSFGLAYVFVKNFAAIVGSGLDISSFAVKMLSVA